MTVHFSKEGLEWFFPPFINFTCKLLEPRKLGFQINELDEGNVFFGRGKGEKRKSEEEERENQKKKGQS